ncbi:hypothetical protein DXG01_012423 [Tephrocybe rancida]|nr:hypothetical protein DXG01_012423 [Tephrocybe rancida]
MEAWLSEYQGSSNTQRGDQASQVVTASNLNTASTDAPSAGLGISSLAELALKPSIDHALETGNIQDIEQLMWLPGKAEAILSMLKAYNPFPGAALLLLAQVLNYLGLRKHADLSNFALSTTLILPLVNDLKFRDLQALDLSHNKFVTIDSIHAILEIVSGLRRLIVLETSITDQSLFASSKPQALLQSRITHPPPFD